MAKSKFQKWLAKFECVDLPIGDLAKDIALDNTFPTVSDKEKILDYLRTKGASYAALDTFEKAWQFYLIDNDR